MQAGVSSAFAIQDIYPFSRCQPNQPVLIFKDVVYDIVAEREGIVRITLVECEFAQSQMHHVHSFVGAYPDRPHIIFEYAVNIVAAYAAAVAGMMVVCEGFFLLFKDIQLVMGANPEDALRVLIDHLNGIVAQAIRIIWVMVISFESFLFSKEKV